MKKKNYHFREILIIGEEESFEIYCWFLDSRENKKFNLWRKYSNQKHFGTSKKFTLRFYYKTFILLPIIFAVGLSSLPKQQSELCNLHSKLIIIIILIRFTENLSQPLKKHHFNSFEWKSLFYFCGSFMMIKIIAVSEGWRVGFNFFKYKFFNCFSFEFVINLLKIIFVIFFSSLDSFHFCLLSLFIF